MSMNDIAFNFSSFLRRDSDVALVKEGLDWSMSSIFWTLPFLTSNQWFLSGLITRPHDSRRAYYSLHHGRFLDRFTNGFAFLMAEIFYTSF